MSQPTPNTEPPPPESLESCLSEPNVPAIERLPTAAELTRAGCKARPAHQLLYTPGLGRMKPVELTELATKLQTSLAPELTSHGVYVTACCPDANVRQKDRELCVSLRLALCAQPLERTAQLLADGLRSTPAWQHRVGLSIEYIGLTRPRCEPSDAGCGPLPYWDPNLSREAKAAGQVTPPYVAHLPRYPVDVSKEGLALGQCKHDGDCIELGCGNHCAAWYLTPFAASCPAFGMLSDAHCGCVAQRCSWFTQVPEAHFTVTMGSPQGGSPGFRTAQLQHRFPLDWIKQQFRACYRGELDRLPLDVVARFDIDARGRVRSAMIDSPDPQRARCLAHALEEITLPTTALPPGGKQSVKLPMKLHLIKPVLAPVPPP